MSLWNGPLLFGHRGAPAEGAAENTLASFAHARALGVSVFETDVHLTRDGHVVLSHDEDLQRVFGVPLLIQAHTLTEVKQAAAVPTLVELLTHHPEVLVNVDIKQREPRMEARVVEAVRSVDAEHRVLLTSFHTEVITRVRAAGYAGPTGLSRAELARLLMLPLQALRWWRVRGARAQVPLRAGLFRFDTESFIRKAHALDVAVDFWTINDDSNARRLLALGADGIMTDDPRRVGSMTGAASRHARSDSVRDG